MPSYWTPQNEKVVDKAAALRQPRKGWALDYITAALERRRRASADTLAFEADHRLCARKV